MQQPPAPPYMGVQWLTAAQPVLASLAFGAYAYFGINVTVPVGRVDIVVTPSWGDPDLFVTLDGFGAGLPSRSHWQYRSIKQVFCRARAHARATTRPRDHTTTRARTYAFPTHTYLALQLPLFFLICAAGSGPTQ
jgi:hypothetical protein